MYSLNQMVPSNWRGSIDDNLTNVDNFPNYDNVDNFKSFHNDNNIGNNDDKFKNVDNDNFLNYESIDNDWSEVQNYVD